MPCQKYSCQLKFARSTHANIYSYVEFARMTHAKKNCQKNWFLARSTHACIKKTFAHPYRTMNLP